MHSIGKSKLSKVLAFDFLTFVQMKAGFEMRVPFTTRLDLDHATRCKVHGSIARMVEKHGRNRGDGSGKFTSASGFARPFALARAASVLGN